jgi:hypothetical protein
MLHPYTLHSSRRSQVLVVARFTLGEGKGIEKKLIFPLNLIRL